MRHLKPETGYTLVSSSMTSDPRRNYLQNFYRQQGYKGRIHSKDYCLWLEQKGVVTTLLRLCPTNGDAWLIRGLCCDTKKQGAGLASYLLQSLQQPPLLEQQGIFCFAEHTLSGFYIRNSFKPLREEMIPAMLHAQLRRYRKKQPDIKLFSLMRS